MTIRNRVLGIGLSALIGVGVMAVPATAGAQFFHRNRSHNEDGHRANALALGAAGLILLGNHEKTLGTIALGAAAVEAIQSGNDTEERHDRYGRGRRRDVFVFGGRDRDRDRDDWNRRDRDDWNRRNRDRDRNRDDNRDRDRRDRDRGGDGNRN